MYDLNEVKTFVSVMETGSLRDSAFELGVSKSTLSRRISNLEQALNQPLLRRQANRLIANEAGIKFLPFAKMMLKIATDGHKAVEELKDEVSGELTVYVDNSLIRGWFTSLMFQFLEDFPEVNITVRTVESFDKTLTGNDIVIWIGEPNENQLKTEKIGQLTQGLYASKRYHDQIQPLAHPEDINQNRWISAFHFIGEEIQFDHKTEGSVNVKIPKSRLKADQYNLHLDAIVRGKGIGILPSFLAERHAIYHPNTLTPCLPEWTVAALPVFLQYPYGHLPKKLKVLLETIKEKSGLFF